MQQDKVTVSFVCNRSDYNAFKSKVAGAGKNVKGCLVEYMQAVASGVIDLE